MTTELLRNIVVAGTGYVPPDGSEHTCGDANGSGLQCSMYLAKRRRCTILGKMEITPTMTCIHDLTGPPPPDDAEAHELATPQEVGLTETREGATCRRCDFKDAQTKPMSCQLLTAIQTGLAERFSLADPGSFEIQAGACCDFWRREGVESLV